MGGPFHFADVISPETGAPHVLLPLHMNKVKPMLLLPLELDHIVLRKLHTGDLDAFLAYRTDPLVARFQGWETMTRQQATAFLECESRFDGFRPGHWSQLGIAMTKDDRLIGDAGVWLAEDGETAELGLSLARHVQGRGLGTEAVCALLQLILATTPAATVLAHADERNEPCLRALARAGMERCGIRSQVWKEEVCTEVCFRAYRCDS